jgi:hypothetical protein
VNRQFARHSKHGEGLVDSLDSSHP